MPRVYFTAHLQRHVGRADCEVSGSTVAAALQAVFERHPQVRDYVLDEQGGLRKHVVVFVDGVRLQDRRRQSEPVLPETEIHVLQALSGG
jgi:molybdopterin synthase sulfur carrier subunit